MYDKQEVYKRDILRDYALAAFELEKQFIRFQKSGAISFSILRDLVGEPHSKGLLWQLKDTARHLLTGGEDATPEDGYLDWAIGFLFHECVILLESSYQLQKYYPAAQSFASQGQEDVGPERSGMLAVQDGMSLLAVETQSRLGDIVRRIQHLLGLINRLMCVYLQGEENNRPLARLIYDREELLNTVFKDLYAGLLRSVFGAHPEKGLREAAISLLESGHTAKAKRAAERALALSPQCLETKELLDKISKIRQ